MCVRVFITSGGIGIQSCIEYEYEYLEQAYFVAFTCCCFIMIIIMIIIIIIIILIIAQEGRKN